MILSCNGSSMMKIFRNKTLTVLKEIIQYLFVSFLLIITLTNNAFGQNPPKVLIPAIPTYSSFDSSCFIPCGTLILPQCRIDTKVWGTAGSYRNVFIPKNRYTWALAIAHAWGYTRNALKMPSNRFSMDVFLAMLNNESELGCIPGTQWDAGRGSPYQAGEDGASPSRYLHDGCYQMQSGASWNSDFASEMRQAYPVRLSNSNPQFYFSNNFERQSITIAYELVKEMQWARYKFGVDLYALSVGASDPLALNKVFCAFHNNGTWSFGTSLCKYVYDNRVSLQTNANWPNFGGLGHATYLSECGATMSVLEGLTTHGNYPGGVSQKFEDFDQNIPWDTVSVYLSYLKPFYNEYSAAAWTALTNKVQAKFISISGSVTTPIKFKQLGPVIDQIILELPKEDAIIPSLTNTSFPPTWDGTSNGWGSIVPTGRIGLTNTTECLGNSYQVSAIVEGGDNPANTYKWYENGTLISSSTTKNIVRTPTTAGTYTYRLEMCNSNGCLQAGCDKVVTVNNCNTCGMTATATATNTPCQNMKAGSITLTIGGATNYTVNYTGPVSGSLAGTTSTFTINNLPDGFYNIEVIKQGSPTCKAVVSKTVQFTTAQNASLKGQLVNISPACTANLQADIIANPVPCLWTVNFYTDPSYYYFPAVNVVIKSTNSPAGSYQSNIKNGWMNTGKAELYASSGENIDIDMNITPTPGAALIQKMYFEIVNSQGTIVWSGYANDYALSYGVAGHPDVINYHVKTFNVTCPPPPALNYTFTWNPSITVTSSTAMQSKGNVKVTTSDVKYVVTAKMGGCELTDTVLVAGNAACVTACTAPSTTPTFVSTTVSACSPATGADVVATLPNGVYYQLFNSSTNAAIGTSAGPTASVGNVTFTNVAAGSYHVRIASSAANLTAATCYKASTTPVTVSITTTPSAPTTPTNPVIYCQGATATALTATGTNLKWYTVATLGTALAGAPTPVTTATGTTSYWVSQTTGTCEGPRLKIDVTVNATPLAPTTATNPVVYCQNATATALTATGTNLKWYTVATLGTALAGAPTPVTTATGTNSYWVSSTTGTCEGPRLKIDVIVNTTPTAPTTPTNPITYCQGATATALTATGTNLKWYTVATLGTALAGAPTPLTTATGTTSYWVSQTTGTCEGPRLKIDVTVNATPSAPTTTVNPITYCQNATAAALTATGTNLKWYTVATLGTALAGAPTPVTTATGTTSYWVSQTTGTCEGPRLKIDVMVNAPPSAPTTTTNPITYCQNATATALTATGTNLQWYTVATNGTALASAPTPVTTATGTTSYWVSQIVGCESARLKIDVTVNATPSVPTTTTNPITYCQGATAAALTATGTNLKWYTVATLGTALAGAPTPLTTSTGTTSYWVSQTTGTCEGPRLKIDVTVNATPLAPTTTVDPVVYCQNATAAALTATGTNLKWYTVATLGTALAGAPTPLTTATGTTSYWVSSSTGSCEGPRLKIDVTVNATPSAPGVTPVAYCQNVIATALTATGTNLKWYTVATNGTALSGAPTPVTTTVGTTSYWVSSTLGSCEGPRTQIDVVVSTSLAAPTVTAVNYCQGATASALTAGGTNLKWYTDPVTGTGTTTAPTPLTTTVGLTSYYVSQVSGTCESPRAKLDVTINANPSAPGVSNPGAYCIGATASVLTATGTNLKWYDVATLGTALSGAPTPTTTASGTTSYYVSQTVVGCESPRAQIDVVVNAGPVAPTTATNPVVYCQNATASPLTATGTGLKWYDVATLGTALAGAPTPSTATSGSPVVSYWVSQTISGCEGARLQIDVNVVSSLGAPLTSNPAPYCQGATASALTASGTNLKWYTDPVTGTGTTTAPTPLTTTVGTTSYYVSEVSGTCESPRAKIDVIVTASPIAPLTSNPAPYCQGVTASALTATGTNLKWYTDPVTGTGSTTAPTPLTTTAGTTSYYVSQTSGTCESGRSKIDVIVNAIPVAPGTSSPSPYCVGGTAAVLTATGTNLLWYTINPGGIGSSTAPTPTTTSDGTTSYWVSQTVSGCESPRSKVDVTVNTTPSAPVVINPPAYCQGDIASQLTAVGASLLWYTDPISGTGNTSAPTPSTLIGGTTSYYVSLTLNGCEGQRAKIDVVVKPNPNKGLVVAGSDACLGTDATVTVQGSENGVTYEAYKDGVKIGTGSGNGGILSITVTTSNFVEGINTVNFKAIGCGSVDLDNKAEVVIIGKPEVISGPANAIICNNANTGLTYSISPVAGATSYLWSIDNEGKVNGSSTATTTSPDVSVDLTASNINPTNITVYAVTANGFKSCESSSAVIKQLQGYQPEDLLLSSDKICEGDEITFTISNPNAEYYLWDISTPATTVGTDGASEIVRRFDVAGSFTVTLTPSHPCKVPGSITPIVKNFTVSARPVAFAGNDTIMSAYTTIELNGTGSSVGNYTWTSDDGGASIENAGSLITKADFKGLSVVFTLTVSDPTGVAGCIATDSRTVELDVKVNHLPNAFSPNNDGNHDTYEIPNIEHYSKAMVYIYNQWGELIFKSEPGYPKAWDGKRNGKECEVGAYLMLIEFNQDSLPAIKETINLVK